MLPEVTTSERIYGALRSAILDGAFAPGTLLVTQAVAERFGTSVSPVRDAMLRLAGERLLDLHPGGGFQIPTMSETALRDLYIWHGQLIRLALKSATSPIAIDISDRLAQIDPQDSNAIASATGDLFLGLAAHSRNREHVDAIRYAGDRLRPTRLQEEALKARLDELKAIAILTNSGRESAMRDAIWAYHRRRLRRIPDLLRALYNGRPRPVPLK